MIHEDNTATFRVGKTDCGQGTGTSFRQLMSDELDIAYDKTTCIMGSTDVTVDQGGSGGSTAIERDPGRCGAPLPKLGRVLLEMAFRAPECSGRAAGRQRRRYFREGQSREEASPMAN